MRLNGAGVLEIVVRECPLAGQTLSARDVAEQFGIRDGRAVAGYLRHLERAALVVEFFDKAAGVKVYAPSKRGRQVDAELQEITAARGGTFKPLVQTSLDMYERHAVL